MVANGVGAVLQFSIIIILNRTERGEFLTPVAKVVHLKTRVAEKVII